MSTLICSRIRLTYFININASRNKQNKILEKVNKIVYNINIRTFVHFERVIVTDRVILHCDLNNFFASASITQNPSLKLLPVAVCGDTEKRHGIVLAKNNIAKKRGVKTAEAIWEAKLKCPELVTVSPDYSLYKKFSNMAKEIYLSYSDKVEPFGIDECWVDISNRGVTYETGVKTANEIRQKIKSYIGITVSVGVSFNKTFAKLGSDLKKPDAVTLISPENFKEKIWPLKCSDMIMVGKATEASLKSLGIFSIGDLAAADEGALIKKLGKNGRLLKKIAMGEDDGDVSVFSNAAMPKSISHSETSEKDLTTYEEIFSSMLKFSEDICESLKNHRLMAKTVSIHLLTNDFQKKEVQAPLDFPTDISAVIAEKAMQLFKSKFTLKKPFRAVGVRVTGLESYNSASKQLNLFDNEERIQTLETIEDKIINIRSKYGKDSLKRAICIKPSAKKPGSDIKNM